MGEMGGIPVAKITEEQARYEDAADSFVRAVRCWNISKTAEAIEKGADVNRPYLKSDDSDYETIALYEAVYRNDIEHVALLLKHGADINLVGGRYSQTPLMCAVLSEKLEVAMVLGQDSSFDPTHPKSIEAFQMVEHRRDENLAKKRIYLFLRGVFTSKEAEWRKVSDESIQYISYDNRRFVELVEEFNFRTKKQITHIANLEFGTMQSIPSYFADIPVDARKIIQDAWGELKKQGGGEGLKPPTLRQQRSVVRRQIQTT